MYVIQILDKNKKSVGPIFFTGTDEKYKTYNEGKAAAMMWIKKSGNPEQHTVDSRIMSCL